MHIHTYMHTYIHIYYLPVQDEFRRMLCTGLVFLRFHHIHPFIHTYKELEWTSDQLLLTDGDAHAVSSLVAQTQNTLSVRKYYHLSRLYVCMHVCMFMYLGVHMMYTCAHINVFMFELVYVRSMYVVCMHACLYV